jgi:hypothetical protein
VLHDVLFWVWCVFAFATMVWVFASRELTLRKLALIAVLCFALTALSVLIR